MAGESKALFGVAHGRSVTTPKPWWFVTVVVCDPRRGFLSIVFAAMTLFAPFAVRIILTRSHEPRWSGAVAGNRKPGCQKTEPTGRCRHLSGN